MVQRHNRNKSMSVYLSAIAVVDTIVLVIGKMLDEVNALMLEFSDMHDSQAVHSGKAEIERSGYFKYVSLQLRVQNRKRKWNFPLNFRTMRKLYECYSGIFQNY